MMGLYLLPSKHFLGKSFFLLNPFQVCGLDIILGGNRYIFFVTLLSIPESSFSVAFKMFDLDNNG